MTDSIQVLQVDDEPDFTEMVVDFFEREEPRLTVRPQTGCGPGSKEDE